MIPSVHSQHVEQGIKDFPRTITYTATFDKCDREQDYATDWAEFERRGE
jgi:hypothetical protein